MFASVVPFAHKVVNSQVVGRWENPNGEAQFFTNCAKGRYNMENVELKRADESGWTFVAITRSNVTGSARVVTNLGSWREQLEYENCLYNDKAFFRWVSHVSGCETDGR